jgi:hypothetical protein
MKPKTNSSSKQAGVMEAAFIQTFLSDVKELRTKINMHQGVADAQPIFARVVAVTEIRMEEKKHEILQQWTS